MERMDPLMGSMRVQLMDASLCNGEKERIKKLYQERKESITPVYEKIACDFVALHQTSRGLAESGVINVSN